MRFCAKINVNCGQDKKEIADFNFCFVIVTFHLIAHYVKPIRHNNYTIQ